MFDEVFGEVTLDWGGYVARKEIIFFGKSLTIDVHIKVDEDETIKPIQCDAYKAFMQNWEEIQHKIANAILKYYNESEKEAYILFNRDWGGKDLEDNGVAVLIEDEDVSRVGYKDIAYQ